MASATTTYNFTDEEVSHLANCDTQDDFLHNFQRILQSKGIDVTGVHTIPRETMREQGKSARHILVSFRESQDKYGSHLVDPLG